MQQAHYTFYRNFRTRQSYMSVFYFWHRLCQRAGKSIGVLQKSSFGCRCAQLFVAFFLLFAVPLVAGAASITLAWNSNNPPPLEYQIFLRKSGQTYNYSSPAWHGTATQCTLNNLDDGQTYYVVARAYSGTDQSTDSNEVEFTTSVAAANQAPVAQAGADQAVSAGARVTLDGSASQDPDGSISAFQWTQTGGQTVTLEGASTAKPSFYAPDVTSNTNLTFQIKVSDQQGLSAVDTCKVTVVPVSLPSSGDTGNTTDDEVDNGSSGGVTSSNVIVDNADAEFSTVGYWRSSKWATGFYDTDYTYTYAGGGSATATFTIQVPTSGNYEIAAQWTSHSTRAPDAPFTLVNNGVVVDTVFVDQRFDGGQFNLLTGPASLGDGVYALDAGILEVTLSNDAAGNVVADAVQVVDIGSTGNLSPDGVIDTPSSSVINIIVGDFVDFTGTGSDPEDGNSNLTYLWRFGTGSGLADSTVEDAGPMQFNNVGEFAVSFTVTDSQGLVDPTPDQVTVRVTSGDIIPATVILDNRDAEFSTVGRWKPSKWAAGFYGSNYVYTDSGDGSATATFTIQVPTSGNYEIAAQWTSHSTRAPDAPFTLVNNGVVVDTIFVDQRINGGQFNPLGNGVYALDAGVLEVTLSNDAAGNVVADAVRIGP